MLLCSAFRVVANVYVLTVACLPLLRPIFLVVAHPGVPSLNHQHNIRRGWSLYSYKSEISEHGSPGQYLA